MTHAQRQRNGFIGGTALFAAVFALILMFYLDEIVNVNGQPEAFSAGTIGASTITFWQGLEPGSLQPAWFDSENWKKKVPGKNVDVIIDKGHSSERLDAEAPAPSDGDTASTHDLYIYAGGKLTFASMPVSGALKVYGTFHVGYQADVTMGNGMLIAEGDVQLSDASRYDAGNGTVIFRGSSWRSGSPTAFFSHLSTVIFEGSASQTITGDVTFHDLDLRTADTVVVEGHVAVTNDLRLGPATIVVVREGASFLPPTSYAADTRISDMNIRNATRTAAQTSIAKATAPDVPSSLSLEPNFPNPFNPTTTIRFTTAGAEQTTLKVYDIQGREIATLFNEFSASGQTYSVRFDGTGLSSGTYLYVLRSGALRKTGKMVLAR